MESGLQERVAGLRHDVRARYQANPTLVSVDVAGPSAASTETLMPDNANTGSQPQFLDILPNAMWLKLLAFAYPGQTAYQKSDQAFIDQWNAAIDTFGKVFSGVTLVLWAEPGLPNLAATGYAVPAAFKDACPTVDMDCAAVTTILAHFVDPSRRRPLPRIPETSPSRSCPEAFATEAETGRRSSESDPSPTWAS